MIYYSNFDFKSNNYDFRFDTNLDDIKNWFIRNSHKYKGPKLFEFAIGNCRFDMINLQFQNKWNDNKKQYITSNKQVIIYEFKVNRYDFLNDKKWQNYLEYCNKLIFVCPKGIINPDELPKGIGLIYVYRWKHKEKNWNIRNMLNSNYVGIQRMKLAKRREIDEVLYNEIIMRAINKLYYRNNGNNIF